METQNAALSAPKKKPKPEVVGEVDCQHCGRVSAVKKTNPQSGHRKLFYHCPACGLVMPTGESFQEWMLEHAKMYGADGQLPASKKNDPPPAVSAGESGAAEVEAPKPAAQEVAAAPVIEEKPKPKPKKSSFWDD